MQKSYLLYLEFFIFILVCCFKYCFYLARKKNVLKAKLENGDRVQLVFNNFYKKL